MLQADTIFACLCYSTKSAYVVSLSLHKKLAKEGFRCHFLSLLPPHLLCIPRGISSNSYLLLRFRFLGIYSRKNVTFIFLSFWKRCGFWRLTCTSITIFLIVKGRSGLSESFVKIRMSQRFQRTDKGNKKGCWGGGSSTGL